MAQKRMIDKKISVSEQVANLPIEAQLLFTWMIPHADDVGLLPYSARTIKALVIPMIEMAVESVGFHLESMVKENLIAVFHHNGEQYFRILNFDQNQTLKNDRQPQTILKVDLPKDHKSSWELLTAILEGKGIPSYVVQTGIHMDPERAEFPTEVKRREEKINNTGEAMPKIVKTKNDVAEVLKEKYHFSPPTKINDRVSTEWQDKALRYAKALHLDLNESFKGRWMKMFKQAHEGRKSGNLDKAYSYLIDYEGNLTDEEKLKYFFHIYENGLKSYSI